jgi:hypothetical protein
MSTQYSQNEALTMNSLNDSVNRLTEYVNDLTARLKAKAEWIERHPDHESEQFEIDADLHDRFGHQPTAYESTFNPDDPLPNTSDTLTAQRFNDLCIVALSALFIATGETR